MMLLDLICFDCLKEQKDKGIPHLSAGEPILTPFEHVNNSGIYHITCSKGHKGITIVDNIDFEILFEYSINAIADGYFREAVSSITSAMERYYEFFIKVVLRASKVDFDTIDKMWKSISSQSERQLGSYISLYCQTFAKIPQLLNTNKEVPFRNAVVHKRYIPSRDESIQFGNSVLEILESSLIELKHRFPMEINETYEYYGYRRQGEEEIRRMEKQGGKEINFCSVNIMTTIDVRYGRELNENDGRKGTIEERIPVIIRRRNPRKLTLLKDKPEQK